MADTNTVVAVPLSNATILRQRIVSCQNFPLHRLPVEIRLMIYDLVFVSPTPVRLADPGVHRGYIRGTGYLACGYRPIYGHDRGPEHILPRGTTEMLLINKIISAEIRHVLYTKNTFEVSTKYHRTWFCTIGVANARCVRSIIVHCGFEKVDARHELVAFHNTLVKRTPCLMNLRYMFFQRGQFGTERPGAEILLEVPAPWTRLPFLQNISMIVLYRHILPPARPDGLATLQRLFRRWCLYTPKLLEHTGFARKLVNTARVKVQVGVDVQRGDQNWTMWIEEREPEEPRRELAAYPAIVMSSTQRHAVWKRKVLRKEKRKMEERLRLEKRRSELQEEQRLRALRGRWRSSWVLEDDDWRLESGACGQPMATNKKKKKVWRRLGGGMG